MLEKYVFISKVIALLAAAAYLLSLIEKKGKPASHHHPCDGCKHLVRASGKDKSCVWFCGRGGHWAWDNPVPHGADMTYCANYRPREDDVELAEDPAEDVW